jgi:hypothetical protein
VRRHVEQSAQDEWSRLLERAPKFGLRPALRVPDRCQRKKNCAVGQIRPADNILDAVQENRARGLEQHFLVIRIELPYGEAATACEATECVRGPSGQKVGLPPVSGRVNMASGPATSIDIG